MDNKRDKYLRKTYNISLAEYNSMLEWQGHSCAICKTPKSEFKRSLHVDHDHKTGKVRGLLCFYCNKFLVGRHTLDSAKKLLKYLKGGLCVLRLTNLLQVT